MSENSQSLKIGSIEFSKESPTIFSVRSFRCEDNFKTHTQFNLTFFQQQIHAYKRNGSMWFNVLENAYVSSQGGCVMSICIDDISLEQIAQIEMFFDIELPDLDRAA